MSSQFLGTCLLALGFGLISGAGIFAYHAMGTLQSGAGAEGPGAIINLIMNEPGTAPSASKGE
ncbi:MAG: hypothetical protein AAF526_10170 [Pseudomonadota bacterium]